MKRKTITLVVYMLVCISLVSVGFAAWIITGGDSSEAQGNITASHVTDKSLTISEEKWDSGNVNVLGAGTINFGIPAATTTNTGWLQASGVGVDDLTAVYTFKLSSETNLSDAVKSGTILFNDTVLDEVQELGYIANPVITYATSTDNASWTNAATYELNDATSASNFKSAIAQSAQHIYVKITITYAWGQDFDGLNPYNYYNGKKTVDAQEVVRTASMDNENGLYLKDGALSSESAGGTLASNKEEAKFALTKIFNAVNAGEEDFVLTITLEGAGA